MATLTPRRRSTDCFGGRLPRDTFGRHPRDDAPTSTSSKPAARGRKSRHADTPPTVQPRKRVAENVVILKRGGERPIAPRSTETPALAAAEQCRAAQAPEKKADGYPEAAGPCGEPTTEKAAADDGRCPAPPTGKTEKAPARKKTAMISANRADSPVSKAEVVAVAGQTKKAEAVYSGASFVVSPEPRKLPVPAFLFKPPAGSARLPARDA